MFNICLLVIYILLSKNLVIDSDSELFFAYKFVQWLTPTNSCYNIFLGCQIKQGYPMTSGDLGLIGLYLTTGISGVILFLIVSLSFINFSQLIKSSLTYSLVHYGLE